MNPPPRKNDARTHRARQILDVIGRAYPGAWAQANHFRALRGRDGLPEWPEWCYLPLHATYAIVSGGGNNRVPMTQTHHVGIVGAMIAWRIGQQIIRYDPALYHPMIETPITGDLPTSLLYRLPAWCIYVETPDLSWGAHPLHGYWAHLDWDQSGPPELRLLLDTARSPDEALDPIHGLVPMPILLGTGTVADAVERLFRSAERQMLAHGQPLAMGAASAETSAGVATMLAPLLSLTLYLCSEAPDWGGAPPSNPTPKRTRRDGLRLFPADKPTTWDIGVRLGAALRQAYHAAETGQHEPDPNTGRARPRAHVRRAHWHTFLAGAARSERRLKWLPPIPVNLADDDPGTLPAVVRKAD